MVRYPFLLRFMVTYIVILLPPILLAIFIYARTTEVHYSDVQQMNHIAMVQTSRLVEEKLDSIDVFVRQIVLGRQLNSFVYQPVAAGGYDYGMVVDVWESLRRHERPGLVSSYFVHASASGIVFTPSTVYLSPQLYYEHYFADPEDRNPRPALAAYRDWHGTFLTQSHRSSIISEVAFNPMSRPTSTILYLNSVPVGISASNPRATIGIIIDSQSVEQMIRAIQVFTPFEFSIREASGRTLLHVESEGTAVDDGDLSPHRRSVRSGDGEYLVTSHVGAHGWHYEIRVPQSVVFERMSYFGHSVVWSVVAVLVIGMVLALVFSGQVSRPFRAVFSADRVLMTESLYTVHDPLGAFVIRWRSMEQDNADLRARAAIQSELLADDMLRRLVNGDFRSDREGAAILLGLGLPPDGYPACVIVIRYQEGLHTGEDTVSVERSRLAAYGKTILAETRVRNVASYNQEPGSVVALLMLPDDPPQDRQSHSARGLIPSDVSRYQFLDALRSALTAVLPDSFVIGAGSSVMQIRDIHRSYREARECVACVDDFGYSGGTRILCYDDIRERMDAFAYSDETENRLFNYVRSGRSVDVRGVFSDIRRTNLLERNLGLQMLGQLMDELTGTLVKTVARFRFSAVWPEDNHLDPFSLRDARDSRVQIESEMDRIEQAFLTACAVAQGAQRSHNTVLARRLVAAVERKYDDPDLSLVTLAQAFDVSPTYLSHLYKQQTGTNFGCHLQQVRIAKATKLLSGTTLTIAEIAERVGYRTDQALRKTFKRVTGLTPAEVRRATVD